MFLATLSQHCPSICKKYCLGGSSQWRRKFISWNCKIVRGKNSFFLIKKYKKRFLGKNVQLTFFRNPEELCQEYDPTLVAFKPAVAIPKKVTPKILTKHEFANMKFETYVNDTFSKVSDFENEKIDIYSSLRKRKLVIFDKQAKRKRTK